MKKVVGQIKLQLPGGKATPAPPVGPALGQAGVNIMDFCKAFNAKTAKDDGLIIPVVITVYADRSYTFITKTPPVAVLIKREAGIAKGSGEPNKNKVGKISLKQVEQIAKLKLPDLNAESLAVAKNGFAKFDETVEVAMRLGVDPKHGEQMVRGTVILPHGLGGKAKKVLVVASGEKMKEGQEAGADFVGGDDMVTKIQQENWLDFDAVVATPDMMKSVGKLGKILGPRGLMPNPKTGTVTMDVAKAVKEVKAGKVEFRVDKTGIIHCPVGKVSFDAEKLAENAHALISN